MATTFRGMTGQSIALTALDPEPRAGGDSEVIVSVTLTQSNGTCTTWVAAESW